MPSAAIADTLLWAKNNPKTAGALAIGAAGAVYMAMQNKEQLQKMAEPMMLKVQGTATDLLQRFNNTQTNLADHFSTNKADLFAFGNKVINWGEAQVDSAFPEITIAKGGYAIKNSTGAFGALGGLWDFGKGYTQAAINKVTMSQEELMAKKAITAGGVFAAGYLALKTACSAAQLCLDATSACLGAMKNHVQKNFGEKDIEKNEFTDLFDNFGKK